LEAREVVWNDLEYICDRCSALFNELAGSTILITGAGGFLGYYLVQAPLFWNSLHPNASPIRLVCADVFLRGRPAWVNEVDIRHSVRFVTHDVSRSLPEGVEPDYVIHAASIASPTYYRQFPIETIDANIKGLRNVLDYALARSRQGRALKALLFFSSSEVYGDPDPAQIPLKETYWGNVSTIGPRSCYDESKRFGETLCAAFQKVHDVPVKIVRPFNNYGPGMPIDDRRVMADFMLNVLQGSDIVLLSDGSPTRTFCYVADAVVGYYKVMLHGRPADPYNIGCEEPEISMLELAETVANTARTGHGYEGRVIQAKSQDDHYLTENPQRRCPSIAKARTELGYDPTVDLPEGIKRSMLWYAGLSAGQNRP